MTTPSVPSIPDLAERLRDLHEKLPAAPWRWHLWPTHMGVDISNEAYRIFERQAYGDPSLASLDSARTVELRNALPQIISSLEEFSRLKAETADNGDRSGHDLPEALREFMADRGRLLAYGDADLIREAIVQLSRLKAGEGWKDISTAPKDGTWFLGWAESDQSPYRVSWGRPRDGKLSWCTKFAGFVDGYITHWMPLLPPAPGARP